jgi:hypothetical protein
VVFYEHLVKGGEKDAGSATRKRSMAVSNFNLAAYAQDFISPELISAKNFDTMTVKEKGTSVEAFVGGVYELDDFKFTKRVRDLSQNIVTSLIKINDENENEPGVQAYSASLEKAKSKLMEYLQEHYPHESIQKALMQGVFTYEELPRYFDINNGACTGSGWIATFHMGLVDKTFPPSDNKVSSMICTSKKIAAEEASKIMLEKLLRKPTKPLSSWSI